YLKKRGLIKLINNCTFTLLSKIEIIILRILGRTGDFFDKFDLNEFDIHQVTVFPKVSSSGVIYRYTTEDLSKIRLLELELLIRSGGGIIRGELLNLCKHGIISFHHADNKINRGGPPGFWEVYKRQKRTGFIVQLLKDELDGGDVVYKGYLATTFLYTLNLINIYNKSNIFLHKSIESIASEDEKKVHPKAPYFNPLYSTPNPFQQVKYILTTLIRVVKKIIRKIFTYNLRWGIAYQFVDNWREVTLWRSKVIHNPPGRFLADPFIWESDGIHYCFLEDYSYRKAKGSISVYKITKGGYEELGTAIDEEFHLSYPFLFEDNGILYMCPESYGKREIRIYKCTDFPLKWSLEKVLMNNISAADTNIFYRDGKWWMMTNICSSGNDEHGSELHIFTSENLLNDNWKPHPNNPVIFDSLRARNGGLLFMNDDIYRVFQKQGYDLYGEALGVAKIIELTDKDYNEKVEFDIKPNFIPNIIGTHTYSYKNGLVAIDYVK
ncbi:hypothetical protein OAF65_10320, partial [Verrucomicrobiales bacterium]|nr:hypothetical protein [Verrucomicrobiales bacterium]